MSSGSPTSSFLRPGVRVRRHPAVAPSVVRPTVEGALQTAAAARAGVVGVGVHDLGDELAGRPADSGPAHADRADALSLVLSAALPGAFGSRGLIVAGAYVADAGRPVRVRGDRGARAAGRQDLRPDHPVVGGQRMRLGGRRVRAWSRAGTGVARRLRRGPAGDRWASTSREWARLPATSGPSPAATSPSGARRSSSSPWASRSSSSGRPYRCGSSHRRGGRGVRHGLRRQCRPVVDLLRSQCGGRRPGDRRVADPGRLANSAYHLIHPVMVAGIIVAAAADQEVLAHPAAVGRVSTSWLVVGGAVLFLAGHVLFKRVIWGVISWPRLAAVAVLLLLLVPGPAHHGAGPEHRGRAGPRGRWPSATGWRRRRARLCRQHAACVPHPDVHVHGAAAS